MRSKLLPKLILLLAAPVILVSAMHAQPKPDLIITRASMSKQTQTGNVYQVTVTFTVTNYCHETTSNKTGTLLQFYGETEPGKETLIYITNTGGVPLKGGESQTTTIKVNKDEGGYWYKGASFFKWLNQTGKLPRLKVTADHPNLVPEASELNNWWQLNPNKTPPGLSGISNVVVRPRSRRTPLRLYFAKPDNSAASV